MKQPYCAVLFSISCLLPASLAAQTQIGGGTCNTSFVKGAYALTLTGRQLNTTAHFGGFFQANGTANFDGQSAVTMSLIVDTNQAVGTPQTWSGTYTVQANCSGAVTITSGGSATFNLAVYSGGSNFLLSGYDSAYGYSGSGDNEPTTCSTATFAGVYEFNASGVFLNSGAVGSAFTAVGLLQFDGVGSVTVNGVSYGSGSANNQFTFTGTYSVTSCSGAITLSDTNGRAVSMSFSVPTATPIYSSAIDIAFARNGAYLLSGAAHAIYGQPTAAGSPPTAPPPTGNQIGGGTCSAANLTGTYTFSFNGRNISSGALSGSLQSNGTITFDGVSKVTLTATANTNMGSGAYANSGSYSLTSNCTGTITLTTSPLSLSLVVWSNGRQINVAGADTNYVYAGNGTNFVPVACANSSLSGEFTYQTTGFTVSGTTINGGGDEAGLLQLDGQGNVTASYTVSSAGAVPQQFTASGTYSVTSACAATATLTDSAGKGNSWTMQITGPYGTGIDILEANTQFVRIGAAHAAFSNPTQSIANVFSYAVNSTPAGSDFILYGQNLAPREVDESTPTFPTSLLNTSVTINGEPVPLIYVTTGQLAGQVPWDIAGGTVATVVVKNGSSTSNAAAMYIPATGTPGLNVNGNDHAGILNADNSINSSAKPAKAGDEVALFFTGGGPVQTSGKLTTGAPNPAVQSPVTGNYTLTVGGIAAQVLYVGLAPANAAGLYQANFYVPQLMKGTYPVILTIAGQASNAPGVSAAGTVNPVISLQ